MCIIGEALNADGMSGAIANIKLAMSAALAFVTVVADTTPAVVLTPVADP